MLQVVFVLTSLGHHVAALCMSLRMRGIESACEREEHIIHEHRHTHKAQSCVENTHTNAVNRSLFCKCARSLTQTPTCHSQNESNLKSGNPWTLKSRCVRIGISTKLLYATEQRCEQHEHHACFAGAEQECFHACPRRGVDFRA